MLGLVLISYVLMSAGIAISTADDCDEISDKQHWVLLPPQWECGPGGMRLTPEDE